MKGGIKRSIHREHAKRGKITPIKVSTMGKMMRAHMKKLRPPKLMAGAGIRKHGRG